MPDRLIRDGLKTSRRIGALSEFAEILFVRLALTVCPKGRYDDDPETIKRTALTNRPRKRVADVAAALDELVRSGIVLRYRGPKGEALLWIPDFRQRLKNARSPYPPPPNAPPDPEGQELITFEDDPPATPTKERKKENSPQPPASAGGANASLDRTDPKPAVRFRRAVRLDTLSDERERLEREIDEIVRPGGCAFPQEPTDLQKRSRLDLLRLALKDCRDLIDKRRSELNRE